MSGLRAAAPLAVGFAAAVAAGWLAFPRVLYRETPQPVVFSHGTHTGEAVGMSCADCHGIGEDGRFAGIPAAARCAECHQDIADTYTAAGREIPWTVHARQPDHVFFSHATHVRLAALKCEACHGSRGSSAAPPTNGIDPVSGYSESIQRMTECSSCHRERGVEESCLDCHK